MRRRRRTTPCSAARNGHARMAAGYHAARSGDRRAAHGVEARPRIDRAEHRLERGGQHRRRRRARPICSSPRPERSMRAQARARRPSARGSSPGDQLRAPGCEHAHRLRGAIAQQTLGHHQATARVPEQREALCVAAAGGCSLAKEAWVSACPRSRGSRKRWPSRPPSAARGSASGRQLRAVLPEGERRVRAAEAERVARARPRRPACAPGSARSRGRTPDRASRS